MQQHIITLCAKYHIDREAWPGDKAIARDLIITTMSKVLQWNCNRRDWFLDSVHILWDVTFGAKPCREQKTIGHWLSRKAKIMGMLPLRLFSSMQRETIPATSGATIYTKQLLTIHEAKTRSYPPSVT